MQLSKNALGQIAAQPRLEIPSAKLLGLPEKVLQFGTGVLLRGLPDYFIDKANKQGIFNGRVVIVKSTDSDSSAFDKQDGLYTICVRGVENGKTIEENIINASVSRVLSANTEWKRILECAHNLEMKIILSNTTEVGIQLTDDNINDEPPSSFPGKLLAFLQERFKAFNGSAESGMVIVPTELITDNGSKVDRIVPGKPNAEELKRTEETLGYTDELLTNSEVFRLWAIEGNEKIKEVLSFYKADDAVVITPDITLFKELRLRLLSGTHSFNCGLAFLSGFNITREAVTDKIFSVFAKNLMHQEIANSIPFEIDRKVKVEFAINVFERFCNPFIDHQWISITVQYTSKMKMRNVPLITRHYELNENPPMHMATGFAGFLLFMKATKAENGKYFGERNGKTYEIKDDSAEYFFNAWKDKSAADVAKEVMQDEELWGTDLTAFPGFLSAVQEQLQDMMTNGVLNTIAQLETNKVTA